MKNLTNNQSSVQLTNRESMFGTKFLRSERPFQNNQVPVPIETAFFLEDGKQDSDKFNRYYFNFPADWCTANVGEKIIGVRNIWLLPRTRKIEFTLDIIKYFRSDYDSIKKSNPTYSNENIYDEISIERKSQTSCKIISWLTYDNDLRQLWKDVDDAVRQKAKVENVVLKKKNKEILDQINTQIDDLSKQNSDITGQVASIDKMIADLEEQLCNTTDASEIASIQQNISQARVNRVKYRKEIDDLNKQQNQLEKELNKLHAPLLIQENEGLRRRDVQMDGYYDYDNKHFTEIIYSPTNDEVDGQFYVDLRIKFKFKPINAQQEDYSYRRYDFADVMNIGFEPNQNHPSKYMNNSENEYPMSKWMREIKFDNVWDRHSCKVYSSIAEQSHGFIGTSQKDFDPIKYFKLNATDQRFWVEFYSGRHNNIPVKIPKNESFVIEMQFLPYNKMLYI